jgi:NAD+ synthase (glutamine-hydrolysing)
LKNKIRIGLAQINLTVGDFPGNTDKIISYIEQGPRNNIDILVFPELTTMGYPPSDLLLKSNFIDENIKALNNITQSVRSSMYVILGYVRQEEGKLFNSAAILHDKKIQNVVTKTLLPNYDVFNEKRYYTPAREIKPVDVKINGQNIRLGVEICEDIWNSADQPPVTKKLVEQGAKLIINISASPFDYNKDTIRQELLENKTEQFKTPIAMCNLVGAQDDLIFDGRSLIYDSKSDMIAYGKEFQEDLVIADIDIEAGEGQKIEPGLSSKEEKIFNALVLGVKDYFRKSGFQKAVLGLSGGIDSALTACIAKEALGPQNVTAVAMPSEYTADISNDEAKILAENLDVNFELIPIQDIYQSYLKTLEPVFKNTEMGITEENIQSRIRGDILMAIANKTEALTLNTGNKTELALGYCTLYGDMCGAIGVLADLSKEKVYALSRYYNRTNEQEIIPQRIIDRPPSAELKADQVDPFDYDVVSPLVDDIVVKGMTRDQLIQAGYDEELVDDILKRISLNEYKRSQAALCLKVTSKAFNRGWIHPIVNKFRE